METEYDGSDEIPAGYGLCWICDAVAPGINEKGEGHGCDDAGYGDGPGHAWERV